MFLFSCAAGRMRRPGGRNKEEITMKKVVEFLNQNPVQYLATVGRDGKAVFENNRAAKEMCIANPIVKGQYQTADNPIFEVFYLEEPHGVIADFSGNPPYEF